MSSTDVVTFAIESDQVDSATSVRCHLAWDCDAGYYRAWDENGRVAYSSDPQRAALQLFAVRRRDELRPPERLIPADSRMKIPSPVVWAVAGLAAVLMIALLLAGCIFVARGFR